MDLRSEGPRQDRGPGDPPGAAAAGLRGGPAVLAVAAVAPTVLALALTAAALVGHTRALDAADGARALLATRQVVADAADAVREERSAVLHHLAAPSAGAASLRGRFEETRRRLDAVADRPGDAPPGSAAARVPPAVAQLPLQRTAVESDPATDRYAVATAYTTAARALDALDRALLRAASAADPTAPVDAVTAVRGAGEQLTLMDAFLGSAVRADRLPEGDASLVLNLVSQLSYDASDYDAALDGADRARFGGLLDNPAYAERERLQSAVVLSAAGEVAVEEPEWRRVHAASLAVVRDAERRLHDELVRRCASAVEEARGATVATSLLLLVLLLVLLATTAGLTVAGARLRAAARSDERDRAPAPAPPPLPTGEPDLAVVLAEIARRDQLLAHRQLRLIQRLEDQEQDDDRLSDLFELDHLATRMRRNGEKAVLLCGNPLPHRDTDPVPLDDVLRGAVSAVEQYTRVAVDNRLRVLVDDRAAAPLRHLVAELVDNAVQASPPGRQVRLGAARAAGAAVHIEVTGAGAGGDRLAELRRHLADPPGPQGGAPPRTGLRLVHRLSRELGVVVKYEPTDDGAPGVTAVVAVPPHLLTPVPGPDRALAGAGARSGAQARADAATPAVPSPG